MTFGGRKALALLFLGDLAVFAFSLWLTLVLRYQELPSQDILALHALPFSILFAVWLLIFYIAGLYGKQVVLFKSELPRVILRTQIVNILLAALLFFFVPEFGIAPKTNLAIYLVISLVLIYVWRLGLYPRFTRPAFRERAALIGSGSEVEELIKEVNGNPRYYLEFRVVVDPAELAKVNFAEFAQELKSGHVSLLVVDAEHDSARPILPKIYELTFGKDQLQFVDFYRMYEEVFDRVPLSLLRYDWFLKNVSLTGLTFYLLVKRLIDVIGGIAMGVVAVISAPFVYLALRLEGPGPLLISQDRIGKGGERIRAYKFRSMSFNESASGAWVGETKNRITRVGSFLRKISLDEFPQFINVLRGEISLIGPRNDIEGLGKRLAEAIPYYNVRYVVKPGITGWAQINQRYESGNISPQSIEETKVRLAYDFYYIKNRSLALELVIALKTIKRMFFRVSAW